MTNPHGDVVTTIPIGDGNTVTGITAWSDYTEYGTPRTPTATGQVQGAAGYGWLGGKERATPAGTFGLTLMGARLYNPVTGRFTSTDPVYGGNPNTYTYPVDPINMTDLDGQWGFAKRLWRRGKSAVKNKRNWSRVATYAGCASFGVCVVASAGACLAAGIGAASLSTASAYMNGKRGWRLVAHGTASFGLAKFGGPVRWSKSVIHFHYRSRGIRQRGWVGSRMGNYSRSWRASYQVNRGRMARRAGVLAGSGYGSSRGWW